MCGGATRPEAVALSLDLASLDLPKGLDAHESLRKSRSHGDVRLVEYLEAAVALDRNGYSLPRSGSLAGRSDGTLLKAGLAALGCNGLIEPLDRSGTESPSSVEPPDQPPSPSGVVHAFGASKQCSQRLTRISAGAALASSLYWRSAHQQADKETSHHRTDAAPGELFPSGGSGSAGPVGERVQSLPFTESSAPVAPASPYGIQHTAACLRCCEPVCGCSSVRSSASTSTSVGSGLTSSLAQAAPSALELPMDSAQSPGSALADSDELSFPAQLLTAQGPGSLGSAAVILPPVFARTDTCSGVLGLGGPSGISLECEVTSLLEPGRRSSLDLAAAITDSHAAQELFYRLNHARQTFDFVRRQVTAFSALDKAEMGVWDALELLNGLREYEAALLGEEDAEPDLPLLDHALQTAEACRLAFPGEEWMALAGLLHGLGKLLAHARLGSEPQWAICGESFPVGCRFHPAVHHSQYFAANPDRRKRSYASPTGIYSPGCGLAKVAMSWSGPEYLFLVLCLNKTRLPSEALFCLRHQKFRALFCGTSVAGGGQPYGELLSDWDRSQLPRLAEFQRLCAYRRVDLGEGALKGPELRQYYSALLDRYIPQRVLRW